jgi:hypothetical protein
MDELDGSKNVPNGEELDKALHAYEQAGKLLVTPTISSMKWPQSFGELIRFFSDSSWKYPATRIKVS